MDSIRQHGLDPERRPEWAGRDRPVYLAGEAGHAMAYVAHQDVESNGWLLRVAVADLDQARLDVDDVDLPDILSNDPEAVPIESLSWMDSLHLSGQCGHRGAISADKLWVVARVFANGTHKPLDEPVALTLTGELPSLVEPAGRPSRRRLAGA